MNIDDVKADEFKIPDGPLLVAIFAEQQKLAGKYAEIERKNGHYYPDIHQTPSVDNGVFQAWVKDFFWRVTEELAEALEKVPDLSEGWRDRWDADADLRHFFEELSDALHFLAEVSIAVKLQSTTAQNEWDLTVADTPDIDRCGDVRYCAAAIVWQLGLAANCLKNKPWKTTQMMTDRAKFRATLTHAWGAFATLWCVLGCDDKDLYTLYIKKNLTNQFRMRSKY